MLKMVIDTETTDKCDNREPIQISYIILDRDDNFIKSENFYMLPTKYEIEGSAYEVHGLSVQMLQGLSNGLHFRDYALDIKNDLMGCGALIGHNIDFDIDTLMGMYNSLLNKLIVDREKICTMFGPIKKINKILCNKNGWYVAGKSLSEGLSIMLNNGYSMDYFNELYKIIFNKNDLKSKAHNSMWDCIITMEYYKFLKQNKKFGDDIC